MAIGAAALLVNIFQRQQEARNPFYRVVELDDATEDPAIWGKNFPLQYDGYLRTVDQIRTRHGGSEAVPRTPTAVDPRSVADQEAVRVLALSLDETRRGQVSLSGGVASAATTVTPGTATRPK